MGGQSRTASSTSSRQSTQNQDQRVTATESGTAVGAGATVSVVATDYGVIEGAAKVVTTGLGAAADIVNSVTTSFDKALKGNTEMVDKALQSDSKELVTLMLKIFGGLGALFAILFYWKR